MHINIIALANQKPSMLTCYYISIANCDFRYRKNNKLTFFEQFISNTLSIDVSQEKLNQILEKWTLKESTKRKKEEKPVEQHTEVIPLGEGSAELVNREVDSSEGHFENSSDGSDLEIIETTPAVEKIG